MALKFIKNASAAGIHPEPGMTREVLASSNELMLVRHRLEKGWVGAAHSHPHHQLVYVLSGNIRIVAGDEEALAGPGDSFVIDGGVQHQAFALEAAEVLDVFTPSREDYAV